MTRIIKIALLSAALILMGILIINGCGGNGGGGRSTGTLQVSLTDAFSSYSSVVIKIKEVRVVQNGKENARDNDPGLPVIADFSNEGGRSIDVVKLRFLQQILGTVDVPAGTYTQVRLILAPTGNFVVPEGTNTKYDLDTPSGQQSGVKVLGRFEVEAGVINAIMIDFDPNTAIVQTGIDKYNLKPTGIRIVQLDEVLSTYGSLSGRVAAFQRWSSAVVSVLKPGNIDPVAAGTIFSNKSSFGNSTSMWRAPFTAFAPQGSYEVHVTDIKGESFIPYTSHTPYEVNAGVETPVGTITLTPAP